MRQGGLAATFTQQVDAATGRIDITITRNQDVTGASGSGLLAAIRLKQRHLDDFVLLERSSDLGGTWRDNAYPGAEVTSNRMMGNSGQAAIHSGDPPEDVFAFYREQAQAEEETPGDIAPAGSRARCPVGRAKHHAPPQEDEVAKLPVDGLTVVPFAVHSFDLRCSSWCASDKRLRFR